MNRVRILTTVGVATVVAAFTLAGCGPLPGPGSPGEPTTTPTVTVTAPAPEPDPAPAVQPDYGFTFFHEAVIGTTIDQVADALNMPVVGFEECPYYAEVWGTAGAWVTAFIPSDVPSEGVVFFYASESYLPSTHYPRNAEGVGVGSTVAQVLAAYPGSAPTPHSDLGMGEFQGIVVEDPDSDSKYVFAYYPESPTIQYLQWGPDAGLQWSHLCGGF